MTNILQNKKQRQSREAPLNLHDIPFMISHPDCGYTKKPTNNGTQDATQPNNFYVADATAINLQYLTDFSFKAQT